MSLGARATRALTWSWLQAGFGAVFQLATTAIMARLLVPEDFGVVAIAMVCVRFLGYFSQLAFTAAIVQRETIRPGDLSELASLAVFVGAGFTCVGCAIAWGVDAELGALLRTLSLSFLIAGFTAVPYGLLRRELRHRALAVMELGGQLLGNGVVAVALAAVGAGAWAIVLGMLAQQAVVAALAWAIARRGDDRLGFAWPTPACRSYLRFGVLHSSNTFLEFLFYNVEVVVIDRMFGAASTGYYNRAYAISHLAVEQVVGSVVRVMFPLLARARGDAHKEGQVFGLALLYSGLFATGFCAAMFVAAPQISAVVFGPEWSATIPLIRVLAVAVPLRYLLNLQSGWLDALGALRPRTLTIVVCTIAKAVAIGVAFTLDASLPWLLAATVLPDALWQLAYFAVVPMVTAAPRRLLVGAYAIYTANVAVVGAATYALTSLLEGVGPLPTLLAQIGCGGVLVAGAMLVAARGRLLGVHATTFGRVPVFGRWLARSAA